MLTTSAPDSAAHCMPAMTQESWPEPSAPPRTLPTNRSAPGATPLLSPPEAAPEPTIVPATCVPCPLTSVTASPGTKLAVPSIRPAKSGWLTSMPVSSTATLTPLPVYPAAQASGAPISGTLSFRLAFTRPSSHSFATPSPSNGLPCGATVVQKARACRFSVLSAAPPMPLSWRVTLLPRGAVGSPAARDVDWV